MQEQKKIDWDNMAEALLFLDDLKKKWMRRKRNWIERTIYIKIALKRLIVTQSNKDEFYPTLQRRPKCLTFCFSLKIWGKKNLMQNWSPHYKYLAYRKIIIDFSDFVNEFTYFQKLG
jgi:hypothetical protein